MIEILNYLDSKKGADRETAFYDFVNHFNARRNVGSHTSYVAFLDDTAIIFAPPDDWNKFAISRYPSDSLHIPKLTLQVTKPDYRVFTAPIYQFLEDESHPDYQRLVYYGNRISHEDMFKWKVVFDTIKYSKNCFIQECSRLLAHVMINTPVCPRYEFYLDIQKQNIAICPDTGNLLAYDIFNVEKSNV